MHQSLFSRLQHPFVVLDSEWHDGNITQARLISLAVVRYEPSTDSGLSPGTPYYWKFNPGQPIDPDTTQVHGLTDDDVANEPTFAQMSSEVLEVLKGADIGGYSVAGDIQVIQSEFDRVSLTWDIEGCAIVDPFRLWNARERRRLEDAYARFAGEKDADLQAHDAADDVAMTIEVIKAFAQDKSVQELHDEVHSDMVDIAGKFKRNETGEIIFAFGPHKGDLARFNPGFLHWMRAKDFPPSTLRVIDQIFDEADQRRAKPMRSNDWVNDEIPF